MKEGSHDTTNSSSCCENMNFLCLHRDTHMNFANVKHRVPLQKGLELCSHNNNFYTGKICIF